jgi:hypothetical protein
MLVGKEAIFTRASGVWPSLKHIGSICLLASRSGA